MLSDLHPQAVYRCLLTVCPPPPSKEAASVRNALQEANVPIFQGKIRRSAGFVKAIAQGVPICNLPAKDRKGWLDYQAIGREILTILAA